MASPICFGNSVAYPQKPLVPGEGPSAWISSAAAVTKATIATPRLFTGESLQRARHHDNELGRLCARRSRAQSRVRGSAKRSKGGINAPKTTPPEEGPFQTLCVHDSGFETMVSDCRSKEQMSDCSYTRASPVFGFWIFSRCCFQNFCNNPQNRMTYIS
nr:lymphocyte antigen 6 complex locus protein G5c [Odocoileus virginianus texanus]